MKESAVKFSVDTRNSQGVIIGDRNQVTQSFGVSQDQPEKHAADQKPNRTNEHD